MKNLFPKVFQGVLVTIEALKKGGTSSLSRYPDVVYIPQGCYR